MPLPITPAREQLELLFHGIVSEEKNLVRITSQGPQGTGTAPYPQLVAGEIKDYTDEELEAEITKLQGIRQAVGRGRASAGEPSDTGPKKPRRPSASTPAAAKDLKGLL